MMEKYLQKQPEPVVVQCHHSSTVGDRATRHRVMQVQANWGSNQTCRTPARKVSEMYGRSEIDGNVPERCLQCTGNIVY